MRITSVRTPVPDVGCRPVDLHPTGFTAIPERFLARRPDIWFQQRLEACEDQGTIEDCEAATAPIEDQWAGEFSAFEEGLLTDELRDGASTAARDPAEALAQAAAATADGDVILGQALADLAVSGHAAFRAFRRSPPSLAAVATRLGARRPLLSDEARRRSAESVLGRAYAVGAALRTGFNRSALGWIAVSAPDDPPHRPVNVPVTRYPQFDLDVRVTAWTFDERVVRTRVMIATGEPPSPVAPPAETVPPDPTPHIDPDARILLFLHGHSSRLEECEAMLPALLSRGFTVVAMDLPSSGYSEMVPHEEVGSERPVGAPRHFPVLDFLEQFVVDFIGALGERVGREIGDQISAVIGGSLGGNLCLRLAGRDPLVSRGLANLVPWSAASVWTSATGTSRELGASAAAERAWEPEADDSRREYFYQVFYAAPREFALRPQPEYWYRDGDWEPCKSLHIRGALADRQEVYNPVFRRWHWRVASDQLYFSHREPRHRSARILNRALFAAGTGDNYAWSHIHDATRHLSVELINPPGRLLSLDHTGHSIHVEQPEAFAGHIAGFVPPLRPVDGRTEVWTAPVSLGGSSSSEPTAAVQEDGTLDVFTLDDTGQVQHVAQTAPDGDWGPWRTLDGGLDGSDSFVSNIAVGTKQNGQLEVFATLAAVPWLAHAWQADPNGAWGDWEKGNDTSQLIGGATADVAVVERVGDGPSRLLLAIALRTNGRIHVRGQNRLDSWWQDGFDLGQSSVTLVGRPAAALDRQRRVHIFARAADGTLWRIYETSPDTWTDSWTRLGTVAGDPGAALDAGGRLHVFARGDGGDLRTITELVPGSSRMPAGSWGPWHSLGGDPAPGARPVAARNAWGELQVFVRWSDGSVRTRRQLDGEGLRWTEWLALPVSTDREPAVAMNQDGTLSLFAVGRDGEVSVTRQHNPFEEDAGERAVTATRKAADGDIVALCNPGAAWSPRGKDDAIRDILTGANTYYVPGDSGRTDIHVVDGVTGRYLRTDPDATERNNLEELPDC